MNFRLRQIMISMAMLWFAPLGAVSADEACEVFLRGALDRALYSEGQNSTDHQSRLATLIHDHVDTLALSKFTLGKHAKSVSPIDLETYHSSLSDHLEALLWQQIEGAQSLSADILKSVDRTPRDCFVETVIHRDGSEDVMVIWRVRFANDVHRILDVALILDGNQIWLGIELRAQVVVLFEQTGGDMAAILDRLEFDARS
ncbi:MAG: ABC transporter substrate-binding protein [Pseudomonadota bacterium]